MKNVTLSVPDELLNKAREYAHQNGTSLNEMIRELLRQRVDSKNSNLSNFLESTFDKWKVKTKEIKFDRNEIYER